MNRIEIEIGENKVAYALHLEDAERNFFNEFDFMGQLTTFQPKTFLSSTNISEIRPLVYLPQFD